MPNFEEFNPELDQMLDPAGNPMEASDETEPAEEPQPVDAEGNLIPTPEAPEQQEPADVPEVPEAEPEPEPELVPVFVPSQGIETIPQNIDGKPVHFVHGSVNGVPFKVECNKQVMVEPHIADALKGVSK